MSASVRFAPHGATNKASATPTLLAHKQPHHLQPPHSVLAHFCTRVYCDIYISLTCTAATHMRCALNADEARDKSKVNRSHSQPASQPSSQTLPRVTHSLRGSSTTGTEAGNTTQHNWQLKASLSRKDKVVLTIVFLPHNGQENVLV